MQDILTTFFVLTLTHFVADFGLQFGNIGVGKRGFNRYMLTHITFILLAAFLSLLIMSKSIILSLVISTAIAMTHLIIDIIKAEIGIRMKLFPMQYLYWPLLGLDQSLHITAIYLILTSIIQS